MIAEMRKLEALYRRGVITRELLANKLVQDCLLNPVADVLPSIPPGILGPFREWVMSFPNSENVYRLGGPPFSRQELATVRTIRDWFVEHEPVRCLDVAAE